MTRGAASLEAHATSGAFDTEEIPGQCSHLGRPPTFYSLYFTGRCPP